MLFGTEKKKQSYVEIYNQKWNKCLREANQEKRETGCRLAISDIATEIFEKTANAEEVVGYYIVYHKENALQDWLENTKGLTLSEQDRNVQRILKALYENDL